MLIQSSTPVELHPITETRSVWVKREDLCCPLPGPSFSKIRGVEMHLRGRRETVIGALDTLHSKAGWGVSFICRALGKKAVVYYPKYKGEKELRENQLMCQSLGAVLRPLDAGRSAILYHRAKKDLSKWPNSYMLPNALKLRESVEGTASEVASVPRELLEEGASWITSISSGTIAAGVLRGLALQRARVSLFLHMGYSRSPEEVLKYVRSKANRTAGINLNVIDEGYGYADKVSEPCPFPCNEFYDLKAWKWLRANIDRFKGPVLFWNVGA